MRRMTSLAFTIAKLLNNVECGMSNVECGMLNTNSTLPRAQPLSPAVAAAEEDDVAAAAQTTGHAVAVAVLEVLSEDIDVGGGHSEHIVVVAACLNELTQRLASDAHIHGFICGFAAQVLYADYGGAGFAGHRRSAAASAFPGLGGAQKGPRDASLGVAEVHRRGT